VIDCLQSEAASGLGQEQGVEARGELPPATDLPTFNIERLCKSSGIRYHFQGDKYFTVEMDYHSVDEHGPRTTRAKFCSDRCRNLYRDSISRRLRVYAAEVGGVPVGYELIRNYRNSGKWVFMNKKTLRIYHVNW